MKKFCVTGIAAAVVLAGCTLVLPAASARAADLGPYDSYAGGDYPDAPPPPPPGPYAAGPYGPGGCLGPEGIADQLSQTGWYDIRPLGGGPDQVVFTARRQQGLLYRLSVEVCSGDLINAQLLNGGGYGPGYGGPVDVAGPPVWGGPYGPRPYGPGPRPYGPRYY